MHASIEHEQHKSKYFCKAIFATSEPISRGTVDHENTVKISTVADVSDEGNHQIEYYTVFFSAKTRAPTKLLIIYIYI